MKMGTHIIVYMLLGAVLWMQHAHTVIALHTIEYHFDTLFSDHAQQSYKQVFESLQLVTSSYHLLCQMMKESFSSIKTITISSIGNNQLRVAFLAEPPFVLLNEDSVITREFTVAPRFHFIDHQLKKCAHITAIDLPTVSEDLQQFLRKNFKKLEEKYVITWQNSTAITLKDKKGPLSFIAHLEAIERINTVSPKIIAYALEHKHHWVDTRFKNQVILFNKKRRG